MQLEEAGEEGENSFMEDIERKCMNANKKRMV